MMKVTPPPSPTSDSHHHLTVDASDGSLVLGRLLLAPSLHARLDPLLGQLVVLLLHLGQVIIDLLLEASKADLVRIHLTFTEEADRVRQRIVFVLRPILCVSHVLHALS